ncbi:MAG: hypothetical protein V4651_11445 [Bacteroidota bacterium]
MNKIKMIAISVFAVVTSAYAQNETDALKYTETFLGGTARSQGAAGAFGAIGADFSSTMINPAGLGLYRRNEATFGMGIEYNNSKATYLGNTSTDFRGNFNIPTWGLVGTKVYSEMGEDRKVGLVSWSLAAGMNRVSSYQSNIKFNGINNQNSILDYFKYSANSAGDNANNIIDGFNSSQNPYANSPGAMAYNFYLLDTAANATTYTSLKDGVAGARFLQQQQMQTRGAANEFNISSGMNLGNIVYLGAGLIMKYAYSQTDILYSENAQGTVPNYTSTSFRQEITSNGSGVSGRFGILVRPLDWLKLGMAAQTPSRMYMRDNYKYTLNTTNFGQARSFDPNRFDFFDYQVVTPSKLTFSGAATILSRGFISVDYETIDYSQMSLTADNYFFTEENNTIANTMKRVGNLRVGAEVKIADYYRLRAGYAQYENAYKNTGGEDLTRYAITGGIGLLVDRIFVDVAVVNSYGKQFISPYNTGDATNPAPAAVNSYSNYNFVVSGGIRF